MENEETNPILNPEAEESMDSIGRITQIYRKIVEGIMGMLFVMENESSTTFKWNLAGMIIDF
jgi:hypothetical protein